jgi:hypothetical protein
VLKATARQEVVRNALSALEENWRAWFSAPYDFAITPKLPYKELPVASSGKRPLSSASRQ